ncbi:MAG: hypothetical protein ACLQVL_21690 [Terriglobia bacterium]
MSGEISTGVDERVETAIAERVETATWRPFRSMRMVGVAFGFCCYMSFAALYFFRPTNPVISLGQARFTVDALLEVAFTLLALPAFGMAYFHGVRHYEESPDFALPECAIDFMFVAALAWVAVGNGIHLTAKLNEQIVSTVNEGSVLGIKANFHWIRQVAGHVVPHIGWQLLFAALILGQLKRPHLGCRPRSSVSFFGTLFGLLFAHGAIAGSCTHIGFALTAISCLVFSYLGYKSKLLSGELPILNFFFSGQVTFLLTMVIYWVVFHSQPI